MTVDLLEKVRSKMVHIYTSATITELVKIIDGSSDFKSRVKSDYRP